MVARQAHNLEVACSSLASATNNDITSCKTTSYVVFLILGCDKSAPKVVWLIYYFDYKAFARDLFISDYIFEDGYVFRR